MAYVDSDTASAAEGILASGWIILAGIEFGYYPNRCVLGQPHGWAFLVFRLPSLWPVCQFSSEDLSKMPQSKSYRSGKVFHPDSKKGLRDHGRLNLSGMRCEIWGASAVQ